MKVTLVRKTVQPVDGQSSQIVDIEATVGDGITTKIFVKQRSPMLDGSFRDEFVCVASPTQLEELGEDAPFEGDTLFRTNKISLVGENEVYLKSIFDTLASDVSLLVANAEALQTLNEQATYEIDANGITLTSAS